MTWGAARVHGVRGLWPLRGTLLCPFSIYHCAACWLAENNVVVFVLQHLFHAASRRA